LAISCSKDDCVGILVGVALAVGVAVAVGVKVGVFVRVGLGVMVLVGMVTDAGTRVKVTTWEGVEFEMGNKVAVKVEVMDAGGGASPPVFAA
jgi:hypothetical protein